MESSYLARRSDPTRRSQGNLALRWVLNPHMAVLHDKKVQTRGAHRIPAPTPLAPSALLSRRDVTKQLEQAFSLSIHCLLLFASGVKDGCWMYDIISTLYMLFMPKHLDSLVFSARQ